MMSDSGMCCAHDDPPTEPAAESVADEALDEARTGTPLSRRGLLSGLVAAGLGPGLAACGVTGRPTSTPATTPTLSGPPRRGAGMELILLGTQGGPPPMQPRTGIASALVVDGATYLVDCGRSALTQYVQANLLLRDLTAMFLTHLHADHVGDYYNFFLLGGTVPGPRHDSITRPVPIYGPGAAGGLPPKFGGGPVATVAPDHPTPGTRDMTDALHQAYAYSSNLFLRDGTVPDIRQLMDVREIDLPAVGASYLNTAPVMAPFPIYSDKNVKVSAILVPHGPVFPAFGFRFDTAYGSVTFSGDTRLTPNIPKLGYRTDILVHEAGDWQNTVETPAMEHHDIGSHTEINQVGGVAQQAEAKHLVISHLADPVTQNIDLPQWTAQAQRGYQGKVTIGQDLQRFTLA